jgi:hypothetical protein
MTKEGQIDPLGSGDGKEGDSGRKGPVLDEQRRPGRLPINARCRNCDRWAPLRAAAVQPARLGHCHRTARPERTADLARCDAWIALCDGGGVTREGNRIPCPSCQDEGAAGACVYCGRLPGREG